MTRRIVLVAFILLPLLLVVLLDTDEHYEDGVSDLRQNKLRTALKEKIAQAARQQAQTDHSAATEPTAESTISSAQISQ